MDSLHILGLTTEQYTQTYLVGQNCDFEKRTRPATRYFLYAEDISNGGYCRILLDENYENECGSGWSAATYGIMEKEHVDAIPKLSHVPLVDTTLEIDFTIEDFECDLFSSSHSNGDHYYPDGFVKVHMDKFREVGTSTKSARKV